MECDAVPKNARFFTIIVMFLNARCTCRAELRRMPTLAMPVSAHYCGISDADFYRFYANKEVVVIPVSNKHFSGFKAYG
ncbi:hypothetical protein MAR_031082 [Mya arenaria]|uniref:Uncharacterized protein n=1 Tax=Mya arenaria TaxID=6604 RepID=A0ABY7F2S5_MYAAR|nr:hypothetical protein MAR_031082 [Mya arenaria]